MTGFLSEDFLLSNEPARRLYHQFAAPQPILDYHCHLSPRDIAENRRFANLFEIWLEGDHYKWRAMRANGVSEKYITGDATPCEKFLAWARTVPYTLRNPLYHWTHLELQRYFGITELLDEKSAPSIWERANAMLSAGLTAQAILKKFRVEAVCTTDDPTDDLRHHRAIAKSNLPTQVFPAFRPDRALAIGDEGFLPWVEQLAQAANVDIRNLNGFSASLRQPPRLLSFPGLPALRPRVGALLRDAMFRAAGRADLRKGVCREGARQSAITRQSITRR